MSEPSPTVQSIETIEYGRRVIGRLIEKYEGWERQASDEGLDDVARRWRAVHSALRRDLYGYDDGGCVITAFDKRWLDPEFRDAMAEVWSQ